MPEGFPKEYNERIALLKKAVEGALTGEEKTLIAKEKAKDDGGAVSFMTDTPNDASIVTAEILKDAREAEYRHRKALGKDYE